MSENEERETPAAAEAPTKKPKRSKKSWLIEIVVIAILFFGIRAYQQRNLPSGPAPTLQAATITGETLDLAALRQDEPVLVFFWATWCGVCDTMDEAVAAVAEDHRVVSVAASSGTPAAIAAHMEEEGIAGAFPVISDPQGVLATQWGVGAFPTLFIVNPDGEIVATEVGFTTGLGMRARLFFAGL